VSTVHFVVPAGIDDPARPSGGNIYDRRICRGLAAIGWSVREHAVPGSWPVPDAAARSALAGLVASLPDDATVLIDGLIASVAPEVLVPAARRLRLVVLVHAPLGLASPPAEMGRSGVANPSGEAGRSGAAGVERSVLSAAAAVITTSAWTRYWLLGRYALRPDRVHVAAPGVDVAALAPGTAAGGELLCVATVAPHKGHDVLLAALARVADLPWRCVCVGSLERDPVFVDRLGRRADRDGIGDRVHFAGARTGADLDAAYAAADVLVLASPAETYGMVVTEALARGLPVIATAVGGLPEALGHGADGARAGLLVPAGDEAHFGAALRRWLGDTELRQHLRQSAGERRSTLSGWAVTSAHIARVLTHVAHDGSGMRVTA
jgi:glycosyltransferase involved in cell wall biosynthesis